MVPVIPIESFSVFATGLDHPECLAFDAAGVCYAGGEAGQLYRVAPEGGAATEILAVGGFTGGIAVTPDDSEILVCNPQHGLLMVNKDGSHRVFATHAGGHKLVCPNYPLFGPDGSLYVTDSGNWKKRNGVLTRFRPDGKGEVVSEPMGYANGLAMLGGTLFMVESDSNSIYRFEVSGHGSVSGGLLFAADVGRLPDGLAVDPAGNVLCSCYASDDIHRFSADGVRRELVAHDPFAILLSRPTNIVVRGGHIYAANLGRTTLTRAPYPPG